MVGICFRVNINLSGQVADDLITPYYLNNIISPHQ